MAKDFNNSDINNDDLDFTEIIMDKVGGNDDSSGSFADENKTTREKVDETIDDAGSEALQKFGVKKGLADKAVKEGTFQDKFPTSKMAKDASRNAVADAVDSISDEKENSNNDALPNNIGYNKANSGRDAFAKTIDNKNYYNDKASKLNEEATDLSKKREENNKKRNGTNESDGTKARLEKAKANRKNNKNFNTKSELNDAKKEDKEAKKEEKGLKSKEKQNKKDSKNVKKDSKKANTFKKLHPIEAGKMVLKQKTKKIKIAAILICCAILLGVFLVFFIVELILGPLMEAWGNIDQAITNVADFREKVENFYNGFGFQDSKEAFYDELDELYNRYDGELDIPLLLSTIFYTECMGYDTDYTTMEDSSIVDETMSGDNSGTFDYIKSWLRDKYDESFETVGEDELTYNAGKIYRLRKLARNQHATNIFGTAVREGEEKTMELSEFVEQYIYYLTQDVEDALRDVLGLSNPFKAFKYLIGEILGSEYDFSYLTDITAQQSEDFKDACAQLLYDLIGGVIDITGVTIEDWSVKIIYKTYELSEENYKEYLINYYFEYIPEFKELLSGATDRDSQKEQIYNEIIANKEMFEEIFLKNTEADAEAYTNSCVGAIDTTLVSELILPVDIADGQTISFDDETSYGIRDGSYHRGVDLNSTSAGITEDANVYAIADGEVVSVSSCTFDDESVCYDTGTLVKIRHTVTVDDTEYNFYSVYKNLQADSGQPEEGATVSQGDVIGKVGDTGDSLGAHLHFEFHEDDDTAIDPTNLFIPCSSSTELVGSTDREKIWNYLVGLGYPKAGVAGIMGNMQAESSFQSTNVENSKEDDIGYNDESYTNAVDNGTYKNFVHDSVGYGIVQWTPENRKQNLYNFKVEKGTSIGDLGMQLEFFVQELSTDPDYSSVYKTVTRSDVSIEEATEIFLYKFEIPYEKEKKLSGRIKLAKDIYGDFTN